MIYNSICISNLHFAGECNGDNGNKQSQLFVFAIPAIGTRSKPRVLVTTSSQDPVNITLSVHKSSFKLNTTINRRRYANISLPREIRIYRGGKQNKTIIVRSSGLVSVHAIDDDKADGDGFLVYPSNQLGTRYYVSAYVTEFSPSFFCVTSLENTVINVTVKNEPTQSVVLGQLESYRFDWDSDLSGTFIESDKRISVTSDVWTKVPLSDLCCSDGLLEMLLPVSKWGKKHFFGSV